MSSKRMKIGTVTISEPKRFRNQSEYAAWFDEIEVEPCTVDLMAEYDDDRERVRDWPGPSFVVSGPVVASNWSAHYGGVPMTDGVNKNLGEVKQHAAYMYAHALAAAILRGDAPHVTLIGFEAQPLDFTYDGKPCRTFVIRRSVTAPDAATRGLEESR